MLRGGLSCLFAGAGKGYLYTVCYQYLKIFTKIMYKWARNNGRIVLQGPVLYCIYLQNEKNPESHTYANTVTLSSIK